MNVAIIPARGGSKRIPRKNVRPFHGKPIIAYTIEAAHAAGVFDRIVVSTDDEEIAEVARRYGATTPFTRPPHLCDDMATTVPVIAHAVAWLNANDATVENVCCLYATAPLIRARDLKEALQVLDENEQAAYVLSASAFAFPIQRAFRLADGGKVRMFKPEAYSARSQDLEPAYQDAAQFYWGRADTYLHETIFFDERSIAFLLPRYLVQDIDTTDDWRRAEIMFEALARTSDGP